MFIRVSLSAQHYSHTVSVVVLHDVLTPDLQVESAVHDSQGSRPFPEKVFPPMQGGTAPLHTMLAPGMQADSTPVTHVEVAAHAEHGALPVADQVAPATHATWHSVSVVLVQADFTPVAHVDTAAHAEQGALPVADQVEPATHADGGIH